MLLNDCTFCTSVSVHYFGQFLDLVGIEVEFLQGLLKAKDLLRNRLQAAVGVVQRCYHLLLTPQAAARHQTNKQAPLGHPQSSLERYNREILSVNTVCLVQLHTLKCFPMSQMSINTIRSLHVIYYHVTGVFIFRTEHICCFPNLSP